MEITGTNSYIRVSLDDGKQLIIQGEMQSGGFIAYKKSIKHWEIPYENQPVTKEDIDEIIKTIDKMNKGREFKIYFE